MKTLQEALGGPQRGRVGRQQVHRHTRTPRGQEKAFWQPMPRPARGKLLEAAARYDQVHRLKHRQARNGRKNGAIGHVGMDVLRSLLYDFLDCRTGRLDPAIATIAARIGRSIPAVVDALKRLKLHGFLNWLRRYVPTGQMGIRGPQVQQISNAYCLLLPAAVAQALAVPSPDDDDHRRAGEAVAHREMLATLPARELVAATLDDGPLAQALARYGAALEAKERDSGKDNESQQN